MALDGAQTNTACHGSLAALVSQFRRQRQFMHLPPSLDSDVAVASDKAGEPDAEGDIDVVEDAAAVGPSERHVGADDG